MPESAGLSLREDYYLRVRPVLGQTFFARRVAVWDLGFGYLAAEALARTGLRRQVWLDGGTAGGALCRSLGGSLQGLPRAAALERACHEHNHLEKDWQLESRPRRVDELRRLFREDPPDLLLARADEHSEAVARSALDAGVPLVLSAVPRSALAGCLHLCWLPGSRADVDLLLRFCRALQGLPQLDLDELDSHLDGLEARSLALGLSRWILTRQRVARPDLENPLLENGQALLLRGQPDWPWAVRFLEPRPELCAALVSPLPRYRAPLPLLRRRRVLVLGLGTGSLFCAEAGAFFDELIFVDCKEVRPVNPVRQIYPTASIGRPKAEVIASLLAERLDPVARWEEVSLGPARALRSGARTLAFAELRLKESEPGSREAFGRLLDELRPALAVVAMGRSRDDNFIAAEELRRRRIRHVTPSAFPGVTHFKHILTDGDSGPCYDCLQGHLAVDSGPGPSLSNEEREMFYGGSQPATLAETLPSAHSLLRLVVDLGMPRGARPAYLLAELAAERTCLVGSNRAEQSPAGGWLYGLAQPFSMVSYGVQDVVASGLRETCSCGRRLGGG